MVLTEEVAQYRTQHILPNSLKYKFCLLLREGTFYEGIAILTFSLKSVPTMPLPIDFVSKQVSSVTVNGTSLEV